MQNAFVPQQLDGRAARSMGRGLLLCEGARYDDQRSCEKCEISHVKGVGANETKMSDSGRGGASRPLNVL